MNASDLKEVSCDIAAAIEAEKGARQSAVNLKCEAYAENERIFMSRGEHSGIILLVREHGAEKILEWYRVAASMDIDEKNSLRYVRGIIRMKRVEGTL